MMADLGPWTMVSTGGLITGPDSGREVLVGVSMRAHVARSRGDA